MMGVYIKGMEMPETCASCEQSYYVGNGRAMCKRVSKTDKTDIMTKRRADFCPLVEVEPHGDLTDKDKLMQEFMDSDLDHLQRDDWKEVIQIVSDADVVIEAEGETE